MTIKLTSEEMRYITLFEGMTGARVHDCVLDDSGKSVIFVVKKGEMGVAIGGGGSKIRRARQAIGKSIRVIEHSDDPVEFLRNIFAPAKIKSIDFVEQEGKKVAIVAVEREERGLAIGTKGKKIRCAKRLAHRYYGVQDVVIA
jgi:N utilization substance protein A